MVGWYLNEKEIVNRASSYIFWNITFTTQVAAQALLTGTSKNPGVGGKKDLQIYKEKDLKVSHSMFDFIRQYKKSLGCMFT